MIGTNKRLTTEMRYDKMKKEIRTDLLKKNDNMNPILKMMIRNGKNSEKGIKANIVSKNIRFEPDDIALPDDLQLIEDMPYTGGGGAKLMSDIVMPKPHKTERLPVVIAIHGGGLVFGDHHANRKFRYSLAQMGCLVYSIDYRHIDKADFFGELEDVCAGMEPAKNTLEKYGGDPERIFLMGESAGGLFALYAGAAAGSEQLSKALGAALRICI